MEITTPNIGYRVNRDYDVKIRIGRNWDIYLVLITT
jgi:hypothetical protein